MNQNGCVVDDTVVSKYEDHVYQVINAGCKDKDLAHIKKILDTEFKGKDVRMEYKEAEDALVAIQGPKAAAVVEKLTGVSFKKQLFMEGSRQKIKALNIDALFTRCGYTGEDGFEVAVKASKAAEFCELLRSNNVEPCGLGARDSLRLEAGLCLYGHELDETISPVESVLQWVITP